MSGGIVKLTTQGADALRKLLKSGQPAISQGGKAVPDPHKTPINMGGVFKFEATEDWSALGIIRAKRLRWNGASLAADGETFEIRDYMGFGGKQGMRGAYFVEDGIKWHLATSCPPTQTVTQTTTFA